MKLIKNIIIVLILIFSFNIIPNVTAEINSDTLDNQLIQTVKETNENSTANENARANKNLNDLNGEKNNVINNKLDEFGKDESGFFGINITGGKGLFYTLVVIAQSLKNFFFFLATLFYLIIVIKLLVTDNTEEESSKFKKGIIWITVGLIIMQIAFSFVMTLYANSIGEKLAFDLITNIINPFIGLMEIFASFIFLAIAIFAFYRMITANGKDEEITKSKMSILYAIIGFILIRLAKVIVEGVYGKLECKQSTIAGFDNVTISCIGDNNAHGLVGNILHIINWMNGFIGIITILLIIYAGFNILFSGGDEEKIKKAKSTILYIIIGLGLLVINYLLLTFFIIPETTI